MMQRRCPKDAQGTGTVTHRRNTAVCLTPNSSGRVVANQVGFSPPTATEEWDVTVQDATSARFS